MTAISEAVRRCQVIGAETHRLRRTLAEQPVRCPYAQVIFHEMIAECIAQEAISVAIVRAHKDRQE
jgi:hypothetical protein